MSKESVLTRKDMKEPDKFQQAAVQAASWVSARKRNVVIAGALAVAVVVLIAVLTAVRGRQHEAAGAAVSHLLETVGGTVSAVPLPNVPGPFFPDEAAKQRAIVGAADQVLAEHGGTRPAQLAALTKGDAHLALREWDAAKAAYDRFLAEAPKDDSLRFGAIEGLAVAEEGKGNLDAAAQAYARLASEVPGFADRADLERARVLAAAGKTAEARQILQGFSDQHKESPLTGEAAGRLARLGGT
jgi:tetratricopeptide (TPR) repeat protein